MFVDFFADVGVSYTLQVGTSRASFIFYKLHFYFWFWLPRGRKNAKPHFWDFTLKAKDGVGADAQHGIF